MRESLSVSDTQALVEHLAAHVVEHLYHTPYPQLPVSVAIQRCAACVECGLQRELDIVCKPLC